MIIIGVLLIVAAAVVLVDMGVTSSGSIDARLFGWHLDTTAGPGRFLLLGAAAGFVLGLGLMLVLSGQLRSRRIRRERDRMIKGTRAENKRLAQQLEEQRAVVVPPADAAVTTRDAATDTPEAHPAEAYPEGEDYVLGSRYPQRTSAVHTPPAPPDNSQR